MPKIQSSAYKMGYQNAYKNGYYIADTDLMNLLWGGQTISMNSLDESQVDIESIDSFGVSFLREVESSQNRAIELWLKQLESNGILKVKKKDGNTIKNCYDTLRQLGGVIDANPLRQEDTDEELIKYIQNTKKRYDIPLMVKNAILDNINNGVITIRKETLSFNQKAIQKIIDDVYNKIADNILSDNRILSNDNAQLKKRLLAALKQNIQFTDNLMAILRNKSNKFQVKTDKKNRTAILRKGQRKGLTGLLLDSYDLKDFNIVEYVTAAIGDALGGKGVRTGDSLTRKIQIVDQITGAITTQMVAGKDDALWTFVNKLKKGKEYEVRVHISSKLYGLRSDSGNLSSRSFNAIQLERSGSASMRYQELKKLLNTNLGQDVYNKIIFGINNLAKDSILSTTSNVQKYEQILSVFFAAFMFDTSITELADNFKKGNDVYNIYLFEVNGQYYSLAEICHNILVVLQNMQGSLSSYVKVNITPGESQMADAHSGAMIINGEIINPTIEGPFSVAQWQAVKRAIEDSTNFSTTTINAKKILNLAGIYK